jgi:hypothetical protein
MPGGGRPGGKMGPASQRGDFADSRKKIDYKAEVKLSD